MNVLDMVVRDIKYRPGWRMSVSGKGFDRMLRIEATVMCAYDNSKTISLVSAQYVPPHIEEWDERTIIRFCFDAFRKMEEHELGEFFQYRGDRPFDPHR